jgi:AcrR family transcriptional regulator
MITVTDKGGRTRPLRRDAERNRQRVLRAAAEVFTERGLEATLDDVARHAGVGVGTVYRRFADKEALVEALFVERVDEIVTAAEHACAEPDPWIALTSFLERVTAIMAGDLGLRQVLMFATYGQDRVACARERLRPVISRIVERAQDQGQLRTDLSPSDISFIGLMLATAAEYAWHARPDIWRRYLALIIDGLRPARQTVTDLPVAPLSPQEMEDTMRSKARRRSFRRA